MDQKKRKAELQLTAENYEEENATNVAETPNGNLESKASGTPKVMEEKPAAQSGGFLAYAKTNPFASAHTNSGQNSFASTPLSGFGAISASRSSFNMPPPLVLPSPKSPKANPFSSPSPANTQFVTIVENNDDLWKAMANDKLSADEAMKSNSFGENKGKKSPVYRSSFFGGNGGAASTTTSSSFASVSANATSTPSSVFGSSANKGFGSSLQLPPAKVQAFGAPASTEENDAGDDENDENDDNDGDASPTNAANQASMKIISLPENVKLVTGEEEDECLLQFRAKMYRLSNGAVLPITNTSSVAIGNISLEQKTDAEVAAVGAVQRQDSSCKNESVGSSDTTSTAAATTTASSVLDSVIQERNSARAGKGGANGTNGASKAAEWVEVGIGPLKVLSSKAGESGVVTGRLVMRREDKQGGLGTKLLLNARLNKFLKVTRQNDKMVQLVCVNYADLQNNTASTATIGTYLIKTKNTEDADDIFEIATDFVNKSISADKTLTSSEEAPSEEQK